jgi:hypothetical protein
MPIYRYLTKICDQVVALLSTEHSASIVWGDEDDDDESMDADPGDDDRLFTYEIAKRNEQEESASSRPGFQVIIFASSDAKSTADLPKMNSRLISSYVAPADCPVDPLIFVPSLLHGEAAQGFWTASYVPPMARISSLDHSYSRLSLRRLL